MFNVTPPSSVWSAWPFLSISEKLLVGALIALSVYVLFAAATTAICVRKTRASIREGRTVDLDDGFRELRERSARLQKLIGTGFCLFGVVLFLGLQWAYFADDLRKGSGERVILISFYPHFVFALAE